MATRLKHFKKTQLFDTGLLLLISIFAGCASNNQPASPTDPASREATLKQMEAELGITEPQTKTQARPWPEQIAYYDNVAVEHEAFYLEGPFEKCGGQGDAFCTWSAEDAAASLISPAAFLANTAALPIFALIDPPWQNQHSRSIFPIQEPEYKFESLPD